MLIYFIYFIIFAILTFVLVIAVKAITRGIEAKEKNKEEEILYEYKNDDSDNLASQFQKLNKLHTDGILNNEEFKKAKEKLLK
jgi:large-conductance mechanosensitive channel|tara:strand:+ start:442 stop:690 length:249 start_codon:yes stop_codon:yes gene_type:complete